MDLKIILGTIIPFIGTALGSACVFFIKGELKPRLQKLLLGFASGVMVAASVWSLLIPAMDRSDHMGKLAFMPAAIGFLAGIFFLLAMDKLIPHLHVNSSEPEGRKSSLGKSAMMMLAVTLHNVPEGMAVGVTFAAMMSGMEGMTTAGALTLAIGIAIQNFPEGAIISLPLKGNGMSRGRAFAYGALSGIVEPIAAFLTMLIASFITPALPYLLAFAAGAMIYVVVEELIPQSQEGTHSNVGTLGFAAGFVIMMILDVALG